MGLIDFLFGTDSTPLNNQQKKKPDSWSPYGSLSEHEYYEDLYDDACSGDQEAIDEMREEFGDDWE